MQVQTPGATREHCDAERVMVTIAMPDVQDGFDESSSARTTVYYDTGWKADYPWRWLHSALS